MCFFLHYIEYNIVDFILNCYRRCLIVIISRYTQKFRNSSGQITGYRIIDSKGVSKDITSAELKTAIKSRKIVVVNLKLTSNNKLIDCTTTENNSKLTVEELARKISKEILQLNTAIVKKLNLKKYDGVPFGDTKITVCDDYDIDDIYEYVYEYYLVEHIDDTDKLITPCVATTALVDWEDNDADIDISCKITKGNKLEYCVSNGWKILYGEKSGASEQKFAKLVNAVGMNNFSINTWMTYSELLNYISSL